ncbi:MAG: hypothetical protein ACR2HO_03630 [Rubrobacteraceae bacterium]|nr:hypothetical protein [Rubrobacter sp.]MDQ3318620.1 hypothetical protein [Actinomycetota bacterium]
MTREAPNRDMVTLQTCTPIPTFQRRLIIRAERVENHPEKPNPMEKAAERRGR